MKKLFLSIMTCLYMLVSSGVALEVHYCMGKNAGVNFYKTGDEKCGLCGMKNKKGCCSDEHKFYKLADAHKNISNDYDLSLSVAEPIIIYPSFVSVEAGQFDQKLPSNNSPPGYGAVPVFIRNCVFRI